MISSLYIAYPIDKAQGNPVTEAIAATVLGIKGVLRESAIVAYDPGAAWSVGHGARVSNVIQEVNNKAIHTAEAMLAFAPADVKSWGVPAEVAMAVQRGMHVAIIVEGQPTWAMPQGGNVHYEFVKNGVDAAHWTVAAVEAMQWLASRKPPRLKHDSRGQYPLKFAKIRPDGGGVLPTRAYGDDAGVDLYVTEDLTIPGGAFVDIPTNIGVELPPWAWAFLVGRSSTLRKKGLLVNPGIIDPGYRGELYAGVQNMGALPVQIKAGERLAQLILMNNATRKISPEWAVELGGSDRGNNGFGSSGV